ncbi:MAG: hypothetical protein ACE5G2_03500 [Candidatus Krumholzibacteriia bacterium]
MLWVDVLNRAVEWSGLGPESAASRGGRPAAALDEATRARLLSDAAGLRRAFAAAYLGRELPARDAAGLLQWVEAVKPGVDLPRVVGHVELPALRGRRRHGLPEPFETLLSTALLQFMGLRWKSDLWRVVHRCHGLRRGPAHRHGYPPEWEADFAARAGVLEIVRAGVQQQCPYLVVSARGSRFCSKSCSNATFAARKAAHEPRYFADKQDRYRRRRKRRGPRQDPGAFVYMD